MVWIMVPAGDPTEQTVDALAELLDHGDTIVDGGNSKWTDDNAPRRGAARRRASTTSTSAPPAASGACEVGYCMMVGGPDEAVERLAPILDVLAPPTSEESARRRRGWAPLRARPAPATT